jgi:hypothetical protein
MKLKKIKSSKIYLSLSNTPIVEYMIVRSKETLPAKLLQKHS